MRGPHIVIVNQNAPLEMDLRPRREAETLAGAGYEVTLVGGCRDPQRVREMTAASVALRLYRQPPGGAGVAGQIREQSQAMARAVAGVQRAARRAPVAAVHAGNPPDNMFLVGSLLRGVQPLRPRFVFDQHDAAPVLLSENFPPVRWPGRLSDDNRATRWSGGASKPPAWSSSPIRSTGTGPCGSASSIATRRWY